MDNNFSDNIKKIRKEHNLSQEQLAEELGVSRQAISKWESGSAYPEMDKIISICKKYNCNIDDLLHRDIKEIKEEEEIKNNINKYIEGFFKFITDSVNLFLRMKLGSKLKFICEECFIAFVLWIMCLIVYGLLGTVFAHSPANMLPDNIYSGLEGFLRSVYYLVTFVVCVIIMLRIYKARYLDYYEQVTENPEEEKKIEKDTNNKISLKKESKIIVRDPKNSDHYFLKGLLKIFLLFIKFYVLWIELGLCIALGCVGFAFVLSFLVYKTGLFFIGCLLGCVSTAVALFVVIVLLFNFVLNRKSNKKIMIWSFVTSVLVMGISIGMITVGSLNFDFVDTPKETRVDTFEIDMNDNYLLNDYYEVEYIIEDRPNIKIEVEVSDLLTSTYNISSNGIIHLSNYPEKPMKLLREEIKGFNDKKIYSLDSDFTSVKVYASSTNIEKLKNNHDSYYNTLNSYKEQIEELSNELEETKKELEEKTTEVETLTNQLNEEE